MYNPREQHSFIGCLDRLWFLQAARCTSGGLDHTVSKTSCEWPRKWPYRNLCSRYDPRQIQEHATGELAVAVSQSSTLTAGEITLDQKSSWPMISRTVLLPAAMPPPSSSSTGPRSCASLRPLPDRFSSEKISYSVWNLQKASTLLFRTTSGVRMQILAGGQLAYCFCKVSHVFNSSPPDAVYILPCSASEQWPP